MLLRCFTFVAFCSLLASASPAAAQPSVLPSVTPAALDRAFGPEARPLQLRVKPQRRALGLPGFSLAIHRVGAGFVAIGSDFLESRGVGAPSGREAALLPTRLEAAPTTFVSRLFGGSRGLRLPWMRPSITLPRFDADGYRAQGAIVGIAGRF